MIYMNNTTGLIYPNMRDKATDEAADENLIKRK